MIDEYDGPVALRAATAALKRAACSLQPPPDIEAQLRRTLFGIEATAAKSPGLAQSAPARSARRDPSAAPAIAERWFAWLAWPVSVAATIMLCSWMLVRQPALELSAAPEATVSREATGNGTPFLALAPLDEFSPGMRSEVVTATVPRATLAEFGLPISPMRAGDDIAAEFLVGPSGGVLAVRFLLADAR